MAARRRRRSPTTILDGLGGLEPLRSQEIDGEVCRAPSAPPRNASVAGGDREGLLG
jgi:hypothetical protein